MEQIIPGLKIREDGTATLYHGSRGGIDGDIEPISRKRCDFGRGFYMETGPDQVKTLVANDQVPYFYRLSFDIGELLPERILVLEDIDWMYYVLFNRGRLSCVQETEVYDYYKHLADDKDVIIGSVVDDAVNECLNMFVDGEITDKAFYASMKVVDHRVQCVAKTEDACRKIHILSERAISRRELADAVALSVERKKESNINAEQAQKQYRREGMFFDEILQEIRDKGRLPGN